MADNNSGLNMFEAAQQWQSSFPMVLDRIEGTWVVIGWTTDGDGEDVTLRLCISFSPDDETVRFRFDVAPDGSADFVQLAEANAACLCGAGLAEDAPPELWREEFAEMVRRWATVTLVLEPMDHYVATATVARVPEGIGDASKSASSGEGPRS
jgi:hypothetical protein